MPDYKSELEKVGGEAGSLTEGTGSFQGPGPVFLADTFVSVSVHQFVTQTGKHPQCEQIVQGERFLRAEIREDFFLKFT